MHPESEEVEMILNLPLQKEKNSGTACSRSSKETVAEDNAVVECVLSSDEQQVASKVLENKEPHVVVIDDEPNKLKKNENDSQRVTQSKNTEESEELDMKLSYEIEESPGKIQQEQSRGTKDSKDESKEKSGQVIEINKNGTHETDDLPSESQTDTESHSSVIVHDSTKSDITETSEAVCQSECEVPKGKEKSEGAAANIEEWIVSYDPTIMLKDVQVMLNDCLKDNTKSPDNGEPSTPAHDLSFGRTLRSISARQSLGRMRHVTLREHRPSPNSSLFVNTSSTSLLHDDTGDFKILRYNTAALSDAASATNGSSSPAERKRKLESEGWDSTKKPKTAPESSSFLNTSFSMLKGLRRPMQPDESKITNESTEDTKKWCVIM